jgi:hypothetical protein
MEYGNSLAYLATSLLLQKKWDQAEPICRQCLTIRKKKDPDSWRMFNAKSMLGGALLGQKKYVDAEPLLLAGYKGLKRHATVDPGLRLPIPITLERLVQFYEATDKKAAAAKWRKELEALNAPGKERSKK